MQGDFQSISRIIDPVFSVDINPSGILCQIALQAKGGIEYDLDYICSYYCLRVVFLQ